MLKFKRQLYGKHLVRISLGVIATTGLAVPFTLWMLHSESTPKHTVSSNVEEAVPSKPLLNNTSQSTIIASQDEVPVQKLDSVLDPEENSTSELDQLFAELVRDSRYNTHDDVADTYNDVRTFDTETIGERMLDDRAFSNTVLELVRTELAKPRAQIGEGFVGVESEEVRHARRVLETVQEFEDRGIAVDLDELSYVRLDDDVSAGIFGDSKTFENIVSRRDEHGNEHLAMMVVPDETVNEPLSIRTPVSAGFSVETISSTRNPYWTHSSNGKVKGHYIKYRDFGERDSGADYYAYQRWGEAQPTSSRFWKRHVRTADLKSGITDSSAWKVFAKLDYKPNEPEAANSGSCDKTNFGLSIGAASISKSLTICDRIEPRYVWGGLHTRYEAKMTSKESVLGTWGDHYDRLIRNNFMVSVSVKPGTEPYWWDYTDGYFCTDYGQCSEPKQ